MIDFLDYIPSRSSPWPVCAMLLLLFFKIPNTTSIFDFKPFHILCSDYCICSSDTISWHNIILYCLYKDTGSQYEYFLCTICRYRFTQYCCIGCTFDPIQRDVCIIFVLTAISNIIVLFWGNSIVQLYKVLLPWTCSCISSVLVDTLF